MCCLDSLTALSAQRTQLLGWLRRTWVRVPGRRLGRAWGLVGVVARTVVVMDPRREELHRLVEELPEEQVPGALAGLRARGRRAGPRPWPTGWFEAARGASPDASERVAEILREGSGRRPA